MKKKKLNIKLIAALAILAVVSTIGTKYVHDAQLSRQAARLLDDFKASLAQADQLRKDAEVAAAALDWEKGQEANKQSLLKLEEAVESLTRYLVYRPKDVERRTELATTYIELMEASEIPGRAQQMSAVRLIERALPDDQDNPKLHWSAGKLFMRFYRAGDAITHLRKVEKAFQDNPDLQLGKDDTLGSVQTLIAQALVLSSEQDEAIDYLKAALGYSGTFQDYDPSKAPKDVTAQMFAVLVSLLEEHRQDNEAARAVADHVVSVRSEDYQAYMTRAQFLSGQVEPEKYEKQISDDIAKAEQLAPDKVNVVTAVAEFAMEQGDYERAKTVLARGREKFPNERTIYILQAGMARMHRDLAGAIKIIDEGLTRLRDDPGLLISRAELQVFNADREGLSDSIARMKDRVRYPEIVEFFQAERLYLDGQFSEVAKILKRIRPVLPQRFENRASSMEMVMASTGSREAPEISDSAGLDVQFQHAIVLENSGQAEQAIALFQEILKEVGKIKRMTKENRERFEVDLRTHILQNQIVLQRRIPAQDRKWDDVMAVSKELLASDVLSPAHKDALRLTILINAEKNKEASDFAKTCLARYPDDKNVWTIVLQTKGDFESANTFLNEMESKFKDTISIRSRRAESIAKFKPADAVQRLQALEQGMDAFPAEEVTAFQYALGAYYAACGDSELAYETLKKVSEQRPNDLDLRMRLLRFALDKNIQDDVELWMQAIAKLTSADSDESKYAQALKTLMAAHRQRDANNPIDLDSLNAARETVNQVLRERPRWDEMLKVGADIELLTGNHSRAVEILSQLARSRPNDATVVSPLIQLLVRAGNFTEAAAILSQIGDVGMAPELLRMKVGVLEELGRIDEAIVSMRQLGETAGKDPKYQFLFGRLLARGKDFKQAEVVLRESLQANPQNVDGWEELIRLYVLQDRKLEAENMLLQGQEQLRSNPAMANFLTARGQTLLGNLAKADVAYRGLAVANPKDLGALQVVANHFMTTNRPQFAMDYVKRILAEKESPNHTEWARRSYADIIATNPFGPYADFTTALELVSKNAVGGALQGIDLQTYLKLAASRPDAVQQAKALDIIRREEDKRTLSAPEQFAKAQLMLARDDWGGYKETMTRIVSAKTVPPEYLQHWISNLLKRDEIQLAAQWFAGYPPAAPGFVPLQLELWARQKRTDEVLRRVKEIVPPDAKLKEGNNSKLVLQLAGILESVSKYDSGLLKPTEQLLRKVASHDAKNQLALLMFQGRQFEQIGNVLAGCEKLLSDPQGVTLEQIGEVTVRSLQHHRNQLASGSAELKRGTALLAKVREAAPNSMLVRLLEAELSELRNQPSEAMAIYQELIQNPDLTGDMRAQVLNNLAYRTYLAGDAQKSVPYIEEAIQLLGTRPDLLDTRGVIQLELGRTEDAIADLTNAAEFSDLPVIWLHLAHARNKAGLKDDAVKAFVKANKLGLRLDDLDAADRKAYDSVRGALGALLPPETAAVGPPSAG